MASPRARTTRVRPDDRRSSASDSLARDPSKPGCAARSPGFLFLSSRERMRARLLFYNLDMAKTPRRASRPLADRAARRGCQHFQLAVAQRPARVVRDDEIAGSNPAGETNSGA